MRKFLSIALVSLFATNLAFSQAPAAEPGNCEARALSKEGKPLYGAAKAAFMKKCNRENPGQPAPAEAKGKGGAQQEKMKACNAEAKGKKGDERKAFMKECLSK